MKRSFFTAMMFGLLAFSAGGVLAAEQEMTQSQVQEQIYGSQLMTQQERLEYQARMRAATTAEERERIRAEHHLKMQERAKARGLTLPDTPPPMGGGKGPGGMGPGGRGGY